MQLLFAQVEIAIAFNRNLGGIIYNDNAIDISESEETQKIFKYDRKNRRIDRRPSVVLVPKMYYR